MKNITKYAIEQHDLAVSQVQQRQQNKDALQTQMQKRHDELKRNNEQLRNAIANTSQTATIAG